jgi:hypothetical protein
VLFLPLCRLVSRQEMQWSGEHVLTARIAMRRACACRKDGRDSGLLPIAIELASRSTISGSQGVVYSRAALTGDKQEVLWRLAKAVFRWAAAAAG